LEDEAMSEKLAAALEELEAQLGEQLEAVSETKQMINAISKRMGRPQVPYPNSEPERVAVSAIPHDQFYGKPLATACREYLEMRRHACEAKDILEGLRQGGFDFQSLDWKEESAWLRNLAINLAKNTAIFHRLPNGTFGLASWYPEAVARKKARSEKNDGGREPDTSAQPAEAGQSGGEVAAEAK
jgi:hypothetical protein